MTEQWYRRPQVLLAAGIFALTLSVYIATLNSTTPFWDCGEFITTSHIVGVPHQPGTPLYVLMGRVFDLVFGSADITQPSLHTAWAVNFMSAFFSALAVMFVYLLIWELARRADPDSGWLAHVGGVVGALFLALSETFWNNAVEAEVYGLAACVLALLSWLAVRWYDHRARAGSNQLLLLVIYLLGLGVGFHLGSLLVYPGLFAMVVLATRRQLPVRDLALMSVGLAIFLISTLTRNNNLILVLLAAYLLVVVTRSFQGQHFALLGSALFFLGLTVHVVMMIRASASPEPFINQTDPDNFATLLSVIRREQYPPMNMLERRAPLGWQFGYYYNFLFKQFYFLGPGQGLLTAVSTVLGPVFLALVGLMQGLRRLRPLIFLPIVNYLINGEILTFYLNFTDHEVRDRDYFYFAAFMFFAVFIGLGAAALLRYLAGAEGPSAGAAEDQGLDWRRDLPRVKTGPAVVALAGVLLLIAVLPLAPGSVKYFEHDNTDNTIAYEYAWNILAALDENALLFTNGDNDTFPIWYLQEVEKFRRDVTVINLSLINLPWYIKQLKHAPDSKLPLQRSDQEIDELRHRIYEDPDTGERTILMIKDYVLHDILSTNHRGEQRAVFFAVTIPQENMARYYPNLQMEGMVYRLLDQPGPNDMPVADPQRTIENLLGNYTMRALMDGDDGARREAYRQFRGGEDENAPIPLGGTTTGLSVAELDTMLDLFGHMRRDVFRNRNAVHLLGNYPAALNRAGYEFFMQATAASESDSAGYRELLQKSLLAFDASLRLAPFNDQALEFYPLLLVQDYQDERAREFLQSLAGNVPREQEERVIYTCLRGFVQGGLPDLALEWVAEYIEAEPDRKFYYDVAFAISQALGDSEGAARVMNSWEIRSGQRDPEMVRALEQMQRQPAITMPDSVGAEGGSGGP